MDRATFEHMHDLALRKRQFSPINVEGLSEDELSWCATHPAVHLDVQRCASLTIESRRLRASGCILAATRLEAKVDALHETLPKALRW